MAEGEYRGRLDKNHRIKKNCRAERLCSDCRQSPEHPLWTFIQKELRNSVFMRTFWLFFGIIEVSKMRW
jgi:diphthamide synthase (EF-2-diphthine--ammonia ligase)